MEAVPIQHPDARCQSCLASAWQRLRRHGGISGPPTPEQTQRHLSARCPPLPAEGSQPRNAHVGRRSEPRKSKGPSQKASPYRTYEDAGSRTNFFAKSDRGKWMRAAPVSCVLLLLPSAVEAATKDRILEC